MKSLHDLPDRFNIFPDLKDEITACHDMLMNVKDTYGNNYFEMYQKIKDISARLREVYRYSNQKDKAEDIFHYNNMKRFISEAEDKFGTYGLFALQYELSPFSRNTAQNAILDITKNAKCEVENVIHAYQAFDFLNILCSETSIKSEKLCVANTIGKIHSLFKCNYIKEIAPYVSKYNYIKFTLDDVGGFASRSFIKLNSLVIDDFCGMDSIHTLFHETGHGVQKQLKINAHTFAQEFRYVRNCNYANNGRKLQIFLGEMFADSFAFAAMMNLDYPMRDALGALQLYGQNGKVSTPRNLMSQYVLPQIYSNKRFLGTIHNSHLALAPYMNMPLIVEAFRYCSTANPAAFAEFTVNKWFNEKWFWDLLFQHPLEDSPKSFLDTENPQYKPIIERYWETMYEDNREENFYWKSNPGESYMRDIKALKRYNQIKGIRNVFERISKSREVNNLFMKLNDIIG